MPLWFTDYEMRALEAAVDVLLPPDEGPPPSPGGIQAGAADYIDGLLGAFMFDPPRIWAGGPFSGRFGGDNGFERFHSLSKLDELAWRSRIEGTLGIAEREFNGPVVGFQQRYREGLESLGADFATSAADERERRLRAHPEFMALVFDHACEGMYGPPEYGGNRQLSGWESIGFDGDVQPRGWTDVEVEEP
jgi:Gluconate 2-dehydrogenase subunit 3